MASSQAFVDHVLDCAGLASSLTARKMFGEYGLYLDGKMIAVVCDDQLFVRLTTEGRALVPQMAEASPFPGAKAYLLVEDLDDRATLARLLRATVAAMPMPKPKSKKTSKKTRAAGPGRG